MTKQQGHRIDICRRCYNYGGTLENRSKDKRKPIYVHSSKCPPFNDNNFKRYMFHRFPAFYLQPLLNIGVPYDNSYLFEGDWEIPQFI
jgi:hypothetical protein